jgi:hypothetical protein
MFRIMVGIGAAGLVVLGATAVWAGDGLRLFGKPDKDRAHGQVAACTQGAQACTPPDYPAHARPGECFAKVRLPPVYETYGEQVLVAPARRDHRVIPALHDTVDKRVLVSPERVERVSLPPTYRTVTETVVVQRGGSRIEYEPALYDTVVEKVMVRPARTEWRRQYVGPGGIIPVGARVEPTGEVMCLVEVPAQWDRVERRVLVRHERRYEVQIPPVTRRVTRQVIDHPGRVVERVIPAVWRTERVRKLVRPERTEVIEIPPVTRTITRQRLASGGSEEWRRIDCPAKAEPPPRSAMAPPPPPPPPRQLAPKGPPPLMGGPPGGDEERPGPPPRMTGERG